MSGDFFDRLESELVGITRDRGRIDGLASRESHHLSVLIRRTAAIVLLAAALAASLSSEFPATARGNAVTAPVALARGV